MARPGTQITIRDTPPTRSAPTDTGVWFVAGMTEKGPNDRPVLVRSIAEYVATFGARVSYGSVYDALDTFFHEGGNRAYVSRVVGPAPVVATVTLNDGSAQPTLFVKAKDSGVYGNTLNVQVTAGDAGGEFKLVITDDVLGALETSPSLLDKPAALAWGLTSKYVQVLDGGASVLDPAVVAVQSLAGGTDDHANALDAQWLAALTRITADYGPGQVSMPGRTTSQAYLDTVAHALANNRTALLDAADTATTATLTAATTALKSINSRRAGYFWPWLTVPGITLGTTRTVPPSAGVAAKIAVNDAINGANSPAAGDNGTFRWVTGLSQAALADTVRETLNLANVNVILNRFGLLQVFGWRSLTDPVNDPQWINLGNVRLLMDISNRLNLSAQAFVFEQIDGRGQTISAFGGQLSGELLPFWSTGQLYGQTPDEAFYVDVGPAVNTPTTLAALELHAVASVRMSPFAELVAIDIVKTAITEAV